MRPPERDSDTSGSASAPITLDDVRARIRTTYDSTGMANQSFDSVAAPVGHNHTSIGHDIDQTTGALIKAICQLTQRQPATVCSAVSA